MKAKSGSQGSKGDVGAQLIESSYLGHDSKVSDLISAGADPNSSDYDKRTATHLAASGGHVEVLKVLVEAGVLVNVEDGRGVVRRLR